jgi:Protein kinase domain
MPLSAGTRLGPYEVVGALGAGGMGEVYRARDTRLRREVAVKVLPESFAADVDRLLRFEQEARAVGALSHPNILAVHDIGAQNGIHYIVAELLDGETLREKLSNGALPPRRATDYKVAVGQIGGGTRLLSWLEIMVAASVSRDGKYAVISDESGGGGADYSVYLAKLDGSPAVLLGSGVAGGISPDNKWVTSILPSDTTKVMLLPTGIGETKIIAAPKFHYRGASWASDGRRLVVRAGESDRPLRSWEQDITSSSPHAVTPEGINSILVTVNH